MAECVGCGWCCKKAMCMLGMIELGRAEIDCPYLYWHVEDARYYCQLYGTERWRKSFEGGCTSALNSWRQDVRQR